MPQVRATKIILIFAFLLLLLLSACSTGGIRRTLPATPEGALPVDPQFIDLYDSLGGADVLGPAISPLFTLNNRKYQYTQNALMEYDSDLAPSEQYYLANLGADMGITEPLVPKPSDTSIIYIDGHIIFPNFVPVLNKLGGVRTAGRPLTEMHFNPEKQRIEQYFENVGFYWNESDPPDAVHLLAYGSWKCEAHCRYSPPPSTDIDRFRINTNPKDDLFTDTAAHLGSDFTGFALTEAYVAPDGMVEKVYENVVLAADPKNGNQVSLRDLPEAVGVLKQPPVGNNHISGMAFYPSQGELGYNIPQAFLAYIMAHGGIETSGPPITELALTTQQVFRQCFKRICLDFYLNSNLPEPQRIHPAPLGFPYRDKYYPNLIKSRTEVLLSSLDQAITMQIYAKYELILSSQSQEISVSIFKGNEPQKGMEPILVVTYPDGTVLANYLPATGDDGATTETLDPIPGKNGTLVPYEVCLSTATKDLFCIKESFVIWGNP